MAGTPINPPTAMVPANSPVATPMGIVNNTDTRASMLLKYIIVPGMWTDWSQRASFLVGCSSRLPNLLFQKSRNTKPPTSNKTIINTNETYRFEPAIPKACLIEA